MSPDIAAWIDILDTVGAVGALSIGLWAFLTRRIVTRGELMDMREDRDFFRELTFSGTNLAGQALTVAERMPMRSPTARTRRDDLDAGSD